MLKSLFDRLDAPLNRAFGGRANPLHHLGSLTIFFFWIVLVTGIWVFIFFDTSVYGAYQSVEYMTRDQWYLSGVMRSLHRYASDAAIITLGLHLLKEFAHRRFRGPRWYSWLTGVPLVWLLFPLGITGYWLVWDQLAQYVAISTAQLMDSIPLFTDSMVRNFLTDSSLSDRFFTLMAFLHLIGLPIFLVFGIWFHVMRLSKPDINPPASLMIGSTGSLVLLSLLLPATSQGPAVLSRVPAEIGLDWFYLHAYPLLELMPPGAVWLVLVSVTATLASVPWALRQKSRPAIAEVDLDNCNGCRRCADDCPFNAISMLPRSDGKPFDLEAVVDPDACVSCGICVGACPTATPFRRHTRLSPGIDLPDRSMGSLREAVDAVTARQPGGIVVFACDTAGNGPEISDAARINVPCLADVPPPFVDYAIHRRGAEGVFLLGCPNGDCHYRLGLQWTQARMRRERDPMLRRRVDLERVGFSWSDGNSEETAWQRFRERLKRASGRDKEAAE